MITITLPLAEYNALVDAAKEAEQRARAFLHEAADRVEQAPKWNVDLPRLLRQLAEATMVGKTERVATYESPQRSTASGVRDAL